MHFGNSVSKDNCPEITIENIVYLDADKFEDVRVVLINPPYISGIDSVRERNEISERIAELTGTLSKTDSGQIGMECPFLELVVNLVPDGAIIAAIMPFSILTRTSEEFSKFREYLLEDFGLSIVCCYPRAGLFEKVTKRTCIFVGQKKVKQEEVVWIDVQARLERIDLEEMLTVLEKGHHLCKTKVKSFEELWNSKNTGWRTNTKIEAMEWFSNNLPKDVSPITDFYKIIRGTSGNTRASSLSAIPKSNTELIELIPNNNRVPGVNNVPGLPKYLNQQNKPCVSPLILEGEGNEFPARLIERYISQQQNKQNTGTQPVADLTYDNVLEALNRDVRLFPKWSVLIPRAIRKEGVISVLKVPYNVSTNFGVIHCQCEAHAIITASWFYSVFGQLQMECLHNDEEGLRKLEMREIKQLQMPSQLDEISKQWLGELKIAFDQSSPLNSKDIEAREVDRLWNMILGGDVLEDALHFFRDLVDERSP